MSKFKEILGIDVHVWYLFDRDSVIAYSWHKDKDKSLNHLKKIIEYHKLEGEIHYGKYNGWLVKRLKDVVIDGREFKLPNINYRNRVVYAVITKISHGKTSTYSEIARKSGVKYTEMLVALMRNPLQVLIPCHRLLTKKGSLMGFYPLGKEVKMRLLELEGAKYGK